MAGSNRRFTLAAIALPFLFVAMSGLARATTITVNTTSGLAGVFSSPICTLPDAIEAANSGFAVAGCPGGSGDDTILIGVTGTIFVDAGSLPLTISDKVLDITTYGDGPVVIDGGQIGEPQGGIMFVSSLNRFLELTNLTFAHGVAEEGAAIYSDTGGDVDIKDCLFVDNTAEVTPELCVVPILGGEGGAIFAAAGRMEVTNSTFFENDALTYDNTFGGAIYVEGEPTCDVAPFPGAPPTCSAGVILGASLKLTNSTFEHNYAQSGSAIFNDGGTVDSKGNIFADHIEDAGTGIVSPLGNCAGIASPPVTDENYNISVDNSCAFTAGSSLNNVTAAALNLDPLGLQDNGGPSETVALESGSDAIDRIPVADCTEQDSHLTPLGTDQRLFGRPDPGNLYTCDSGAYEAGAVGPYTLNSERVQIARSTTANSDQVNMGITFTSNGDPDCDLDEDALNFGIGIGLVQGTCASLPDTGLFLGLSPFVVHTVNHESYGTFFQTVGYETVSARMVALPAPANACGAWTLNLEVAGLNTNSATIGLSGVNPFALLIFDGIDAESCFDITNAIVGNQIPTPSHSVRRGVRRQTRR
ncbi:MAG: choice-of-anchor Q domain-containing protein [Candidatus Binatus sp.]